MRSGFIVAIADLMGCDKSNMNKTIREVVAWHANYDEFRASVDEVVAKIKAA